MGKKKKRNKKGRRLSTASRAMSIEKLLQLGEEALKQGQYRKARTFFRQLFQNDPERYMGRWIDASQRLFDQLLEAGRTSEAKTILVSLQRKVPASAIRGNQIHLALRQGHFVQAEPLAADELAVGHNLPAERIARAADVLVLVFQDADPGLELASGLGAERERLWKALTLVSMADFDAALTTVRPIRLGSPFVNWKWLVKGLCAFYGGEDHKALQVFSRMSAGCAPAKAAEPFMLLLGGAAGEALNPKNPELLQSASLLAGAGDVGAVIARADYLWKIGRYRDAFRHTQRHLADFPSDRPGLQHDVTQFFYNAWCEMSDRQAEAYIAFLLRSAHKHRKGGSVEKLMACRAEALWMEGLLFDDSDLVSAWEDVLAHYQARYGANARAQALVYQHLGDLFAREDVEDNPFGFFFRSRRRKRPRLHNSRLAVSCYQQALASDPENPEGYFALLGLYEKTREKSKINKTLDEIIRRFPDDKTALLKAGLGCLARKAFSKSKGYLERALALDPIDAQAREGYILACIQAALRKAHQGRMANCRQTMQKAVALASPRTDNFNIGRCYLHARWAVMEGLGGDSQEAGRQMAAAASLCEDTFQLHYFTLLVSELYELPPERDLDSARYVDRALAQDLTPEIILALVHVVGYFRRLPPKRRLWLEREEIALEPLLARAARMEWHREQALEIVEFIMADEIPRVESARPYVQRILARYPDDAWFRWFGYLLDYGPDPGEALNPQALDELQAILQLAESQRDTVLAAQIRKTINCVETAHRFFRDFGEDPLWEDESEEDIPPRPEPDRATDEERSKRKLPPAHQQLDLFS